MPERLHVDPLSDRERAVLDYIQRHWAAYGYAPVMREIANHLQSSTSIADYYLGKLERHALLRIPRQDGVRVARTMQLTPLGEAALEGASAGAPRVGRPRTQRSGQNGSD